MFELTEIAKDGDIRDRVFPIVLDDAGLSKAKTRGQYVVHWEKERDELDAVAKRIRGENSKGIRETVDLYAKFARNVAAIMEILGDMNALRPEQHRGTDFDALFQAVERRLAD